MSLRKNGEYFAISNNSLNKDLMDDVPWLVERHVSTERSIGLGARKQYDYNMDCADANGFPVLAGCIVVPQLIISHFLREGVGGRGDFVEWLSGSCKQCDKFAS